MEGVNSSFDIFIRNYDDSKPLITLTVNGAMTVEKLKKMFSELCKWFEIQSNDTV